MSRVEEWRKPDPLLVGDLNTGTDVLWHEGKERHSALQCQLLQLLFWAEIHPWSGCDQWTEQTNDQHSSYNTVEFKM